jgi:hypothetical protein
VTPSQQNGKQRPVEVPKAVERRIRRLCLGLPEVTERIDESRVQERSTAYCFDIRRRPFCLLVAVVDTNGSSLPLLTFRADQDEGEALLSMGLPFFAPRGGRDRVGVWLTEETDWDEIRELVTESYRLLAPKKLIALLE